MALVQFTTIDQVLAALFMDMVENQINRAVVLAQILGAKMGTGKNIQWVVKTGDATPSGAVIPDGADVTVYNNDTKLPAVLQYGTYHDAFSLTGKALAGARAAGNPAEIAQLFADELGDSVERLARAIAADVYSGSGAVDTIHGLYAAGNEAIGDQGVYAGLSRASVAQWQGNVVDATGINLSATGANGIKESFNYMRELRRTIYSASGEKPDLFITDPIQHERIGLSYQAERRYVSEVRMGDGTVIKLDGGYNVLEFDGVPVIEDVQHPAQKVTALTTRHVGISQLADGPDAINRAMGTVGLAGTPEEHFGQGRMPLTARIQPLATTGDAFKIALFVYPQVQVKRCNAQGYLDNLAA
jgi:hypothetical protein